MCACVCVRVCASVCVCQFGPRSANHLSQFGTAERESLYVLLYDVRVNARECSIRAARDQITHRVVKGSLGACCWSSLSVLYLLFLQSVLYSALMKRVSVAF